MAKGNELSKRKEDAKELIRILMKVPDDQKPEPDDQRPEPDGGGFHPAGGLGGFR